MKKEKFAPHCIESEQALLGCLLCDWKPLETLVGWIHPEDFYHPTHQKIYSIILALVLKDEPIDIFTVTAHFDSNDHFKYLVKLADSIITAQRFMAYAQTIKEKSALRQLLDITHEVEENIYGGEKSEDLIEFALSSVQKIQQEKNIHKGDFEPIKPIVEREINRINNPESEIDGLIGFSTGFKDLDALISGLYPGDLVIVAGRPSMGKTALSVNLAQTIALKYSKSVGFFSMEMDKSQIARRMISSTGKIDYTALMKSEMRENDWSKITNSLNILYNLKLFVDESGSLNINDIISRSRKLARECKGDLGLIVIDYIQLTSGSKIKRYENRALEVSDISKGLKALAKELKIPIIAISQLNRELEKRDNKRPLLSDLRESGALEQDADLILFIYRDEIYYPNSRSKGIAEIIIGKQRNGPVGSVNLLFKGEFSSFESNTDVTSLNETSVQEDTTETENNRFLKLLN